MRSRRQTVLFAVKQVYLSRVEELGRIVYQVHILFRKSILVVRLSREPDVVFASVSLRQTHEDDWASGHDGVDDQS